MRVSGDDFGAILGSVWKPEGQFWWFWGFLFLGCFFDDFRGAQASILEHLAGAGGVPRRGIIGRGLSIEAIDYRL